MKPLTRDDARGPLLEVSNLKKHYAVGRGFFSPKVEWLRAVDDVSFTIGHGQTLGLVGESGSGKSTVGRTILRLVNPTSGKITLDGADITHLEPAAMRPHRREMQIIFQDPFSSLNPRMTAGTIVGEPLVIHGLASGSDVTRQVAKLLDRVGLPADAMDKYPHEFSGGQRQRISIARALALSPSLIVCDEPVSALDASVQAQVINLLVDLQKELELSYLFICHDLAVVEYVSHHVAVMYLGGIVEQAENAALFSRPLHPYTKALLSAISAPDPDVDRSGRIILSGEIPSPINPPKGCRFHTRCPYAMERCRSLAPVMREVEPGHWAACHLNDDDGVHGRTGIALSEGRLSPANP